MSERRKRKWTWLRYRKNDPSHNVLVAVQRWIAANNGTAVVLGGIGVRELAAFRYSIVVDAVGKPPRRKAEQV